MTACCCRRLSAAYSHRLGETACWACYQASFTTEEIARADRVALQQTLAHVIRGAARRAGGATRQKLLDRALLIETSPVAGDVLVLIDEVRDLGIRLEVRR